MREKKNQVQCSHFTSEMKVMSPRKNFSPVCHHRASFRPHQLFKTDSQSSHCHSQLHLMLCSDLSSVFNEATAEKLHYTQDRMRPCEWVLRLCSESDLSDMTDSGVSNSTCHPGSCPSLRWVEGAAATNRSHSRSDLKHILHIHIKSRHHHNGCNKYINNK